MPVPGLGALAPDLPMVASASMGLKTAYGMLLNPGGRVAAYVRSTGAQDGDDAQLINNLYPTLNAGLNLCRAGKNDIVYVLPGHSENITDNTAISNLKDGTRIIGVGQGANMPVIRWTNTAAQMVFDNNDVVMAGLRLRMEGVNGVVKAMAWTGADCVLYGNEIEVASGAALKATIAIELATGATRAQLVGNWFRGTNTHNVTNGVLISNAIDALKIIGNQMLFSATAANGCINVNAAATNLQIGGNIIHNTMTASTASINFAAAASDGMCYDNYCGILANGVASATGIVVGGGCLVKFFQNFTSDEPGKSGVLSPVVVAT